LEKNEGFDFGLWYKALQKRNLETYDQLLLVNDSCILFSSLDRFIAWSRQNEAEVNGMTMSDAIAPHLQSYFLLIKNPAMAYTRSYFERHQVLPTIQEVITTYEVGLSIHWTSQGCKLQSFVSNQIQGSEFSPYFSEVKWHLSQGLPLIKKKILYSTYRKDELFTLARMNFDIQVETYLNLIKTSGSPLILSLATLMQEKGPGMSRFSIAQYTFTKALIRLYKKIRHGS
jgi:lipopolysaccharide biosynthesis protein